MIFKDISAYNIDGVMYYRNGKLNGKTKKQIQAQIKAGQSPQRWEIGGKDSDFEKRRVSTKTSGGNRAQSKEKKEIIGDLFKWLQT